MTKGVELGVHYFTKTRYPEEYVVEEIVSSRLNLGGVKIRFIGNNFTGTYDARTLRSGNFRSPFQKAVFGKGFLGVGDFKPSNTEGIPTPEYRRWKAILSRCYNTTEYDKDSSYKGCTVCDAWLNFQNFASWLTGQRYYLAGYEIDKDLLTDRRVYGPETCCLLPQELNNAIGGKDASCTNGLPCGVHWHKKNGCYVVSVSQGKGERGYHGSFRAVEVAWGVAKSMKEKYVQALTTKYKERLDEQVYDALRRYEAKP